MIVGFWLFDFVFMYRTFNVGFTCTFFGFFIYGVLGFVSVLSIAYWDFDRIALGSTGIRQHQFVASMTSQIFADLTEFGYVCYNSRDENDQTIKKNQRKHHSSNY